jgi:hypothetical protein
MGSYSGISSNPQVRGHIMLFHLNLSL